MATRTCPGAQVQGEADTQRRMQAAAQAGSTWVPDQASAWHGAQVAKEADAQRRAGAAAQAAGEVRRRAEQGARAAADGRAQARRAQQELSAERDRALDQACDPARRRGDLGN